MTEYGIVDEFVDIDIEDELTKAVFGSLQLLGSEALNEVFSTPRYDFTFVSAPEFTFHEMVDEREPDVIIEDEPHLTLMVEAKVGSSTNPDQLSDEFDDLTQGWDSDKLRLLHITEKRVEPANLAAKSGVPHENLIWTSWRKLAASLTGLDKSSLTTADRRVIDMLIQILENQGYTPFGGFTIMDENKALEDQLDQAYRVRKQYYKDVNSFRKDVESHLPEGVSFWKFFRRGIRGGVRSGKGEFPTDSWEYMPRNLWFAYTPDEWNSNLAAKHNYDENYLVLDFNSRTGEIRAGYSVTTGPGRVRNDIYQEILHERKDTVLGIIRETEFRPFITTYSLGTQRDTVEDTERFLEELNDPDYSSPQRFILAQTWTADELPTRQEDDRTFVPADLPQEVAEVLEEAHQLTYYEHDNIFYPDPDDFL